MVFHIKIKFKEANMTINKGVMFKYIYFQNIRHKFILSNEDQKGKVVPNAPSMFIHFFNSIYNIKHWPNAWTTI